MNTIKNNFSRICLLILYLTFCSCFGTDTDIETKNKKRFEKNLGIELTPDIKDIHYYGDFFAIDFTVLFAFTCDSSTIWRIINTKELELADNEGGGLSFEFDWWNQEKIETIRPFKRGDGYNEVCQYLWYDKENQKAYYQKFSM